jgi:hypothetical protein
MPGNGFDYEHMVEEAMRGVAAKALSEAAAHGLPGEHHFYVSFRTHDDGVLIPAHLRATYPEEMTIVIQHQYWGLITRDDGFEVELAFGGKRERLVIPYAAMTGFVDPHAQFGLKFDSTVHDAANQPDDTAPEAEAMPVAAPDATPEAPVEKVISLDSFRKK